MLTGTDNEVIVKGNVGANAHAMTIDPEAMAHIMNVLTNMYSDNHKAVVREYVANAMDSHTEAGQSRSVEVKSPTDWEPKLVVRDYGVGLDKQGILETYAVYGRSTRRHDNTAIGGLGIGSKAGFTLSGQFVVTGIKHGRKVVALFSRDSNGAPTVEILTDKETTEPTGVTVSIAVDSVQKTRQAIDSLSCVWPKGKVTVDGLPPASVFDTATKVSNGIYIVDRNWGLTVEMGGIPYTVGPTILAEAAKTLTPADIAHITMSRIQNFQIGVIAQVGIGDVSIAPNRETLSNTKKTVDKIKEILTLVGKGQAETIKHTIDTAPDAFALFDRTREFIKIVGEPYLRGQSFRGHQLQPVAIPVIAKIDLSWNRGKQFSAVSYTPIIRQPFLLTPNYATTLFITGATTDDVNKVARLSTRYLSSNHVNYSQIVLVEDAVGSAGWFTWGDNKIVPTMTFDEFREAARKLPSLSTRSEVTYCHWTVVDVDGVKKFARNVLTGTAIAENADGEIYFFGHRRNNYDNPRDHHLLSLNVGDVLVSIDGSMKREPLERRLGQKITDFSVLWDKYVNVELKKVTDTEKQALSIDPNMTIEKTREVLAEIGYRNFELDKMVGYWNAASKKLKTMTKERISFLRQIESYLGLDDSVTKRYHEWCERYLLVNSHLRSLGRHVSQYQDTNYNTHMVEYMKAIDLKEDKNV